MSRQSSAVAGRPLTLTEELEKLEQSITLTLQEIDHNFSKAHRIVTSSILPVVEQYGEHSRNVWEATKFWKQFFEASANVSLSGYEELANPEESTAVTHEEETTVNESAAEYNTPHPRSPEQDDTSHHPADQSSAIYDSVLSDDNDDLSGSTPRPPATKTVATSSSRQPQPAGFSSSYEALKREYKQTPTNKPSSKSRAHSPSPIKNESDDDDDDTSLLFQQHTARLPDMSMHLHHHRLKGSQEDDDNLDFLKPNKDPVLHRLQDKNYRIAATPHKSTGVSPIKWKVNPKPAETPKPAVPRPIWEDSPQSSPEIAMPQLRSAAFLSPARVRAATYHRGGGRAGGLAAGPRTPGVSVQTPGTRGGKGKTKDVYAGDEIGWDSDEDGATGDFGGMSPPKTIQFALPPGRLMQTPAREASKRIVDNILLTAGEFEGESEEYSPTVVKMNHDILNDTF